MVGVELRGVKENTFTGEAGDRSCVRSGKKAGEIFFRPTKAHVCASDVTSDVTFSVAAIRNWVGRPARESDRGGDLWGKFFEHNRVTLEVTHKSYNPDPNGPSYPWTQVNKITEAAEESDEATN